MKQSWGKAALALAAGQGNADAAKAAQVTERTVARWRADEIAFADRIEDLRSEMLTEAAGLLAHATTAASLKLAEIIEVGEERHQLTASRVVLEMARQVPSRSSPGVSDQVTRARRRAKGHAMSSQARRLDKLTEYFGPALTLEELADRAIHALEADPTVDQVDGVPIWRIQERLNKEIARLKKEDD